jgi:ribosomal-protein-alanine N-acetyltransferase
MCGGRMRKFSGRVLRGVAAETKKRGSACSVRRFGPGDANAVRDIFKQSPQAGALTKDSYERSPEWAGPLALVSECAGEVTGFLMGREVADEAEVFTFAVLPKFRRQGHGGALVSAAIEGMRSRGVKNVFLEVRESNLGAIAFYEAFGFSKVGYRKVYYTYPEEAAITMGRKLGD